MIIALFLLFFLYVFSLISCISYISPSPLIAISHLQLVIAYRCFMKMCWIFSSAAQHNTHLPGPIHPLIWRLSHESIALFCTSHRNGCILLGILNSRFPLLYCLFSLCMWWYYNMMPPYMSRVYSITSMRCLLDFGWILSIPMFWVICSSPPVFYSLHYLWV